ncbi:MAG: polysaccharide biosynthesis/export family protein, partial [Flavobacteriales bacterium]|nr:polysaccharide biosynthesis/export family protein [Flavobacteriales bacterium]
MKRSLVYILLLALLSSCTVFKPSFMLRSGNKYPYAELPTTPQSEYKIANNDVIEFRIFSNNGFKLIDLTNFNTTAGGFGRLDLKYLVEHDGMIKLPIVGRVKISG